MSPRLTGPSHQAVNSDDRPAARRGTDEGSHMEEAIQTPWGVTYCPECDRWTAELRATNGAQIPAPEGEGVLDLIAYGAQCACGFQTVQTVELATL